MKKLISIAVALFISIGAAHVNAGPGHAHTHQNQGQRQHMAQRPHRKPGAPVYIESEARYQIQAGEKKSISLKLSMGTSSGIAKVNLRADRGLQLTAEQMNWQFDLAEASEVSIPLEVTAAADGRYFIHVFTLIENGPGGRMPRAQAIAIDVGEAVRKAQKPSLAEHVLLPAKEEIISR